VLDRLIQLGAEGGAIAPDAQAAWTRRSTDSMPRSARREASWRRRPEF